MSLALLPRCAAGLLMSAALAGCYVPAHAGHALLEIADSGALAFQGQPVAAAELAARVTAAEPADGSLIVEIKASPATPIATVESAVSAIQAAHARVAFVGATAAH